MDNFCTTFGTPQLKINRNPSSVSQNFQSLNPQSLSDQNLYSLCKTYGARALEWRRKFTGLLPEVFRRKLYEKKGFESIFVFAKKLAGLGEEQVRRVLSLEEKFREFPVLLSLLVNGEVSVNKLARVASIATVENQEFLAGKVKILSKSAVETFVRDEKWAGKMCENGANHEERIPGLFGNDVKLSGLGVLNDFDGWCEGDCRGQNGLLKPENGGGFVPGHKSVSVIPTASSGEKLHDFGYGELANGEKSQIVFGAGHELNLSPEVYQKLLELQQKGLDVNKILLEFLEKREAEIAHKKAQISEEVLRKGEKKAEKAAIIQEYSLEGLRSRGRYISQPVRKILHEEHGTKCSIRNCQKSATTIHHTQRFSLSGSHDPHYLAPLCKEHHEIAHACDVRYVEVKGGREWMKATD